MLEQTDAVLVAKALLSTIEGLKQHIVKTLETGEVVPHYMMFASELAQHCSTTCGIFIRNLLIEQGVENTDEFIGSVMNEIKALGLVSEQ